MNPSLFSFRKQLSFINYNIVFILLLTMSCQNNSNKIALEEKIEPPSIQAEAAKVTMLGVFHFGGSSGDMAAMHMADPFGKRRQDDIKELVSQLAEFKPTKILVEYP